MIKINEPIITEEQIEKAKLTVIQKKREDWAIKHRKYKTVQRPYGQAIEVPDIDAAPPVESFNIAWIIIRWSTGFAVFDSEDFEKLPMKVQNKFLKLGGQI